MRGYTTIEQSRKLIELGLDTSTADMCYPHFIRHGADTYSETPEIAENIDYPYEMPCWSLATLLELMPLYNGTTPRLSWCKGLYTCFYYQDKMISNSNSLVDAAFEMVCWLIENKYIK